MLVIPFSFENQSIRIAIDDNGEQLFCASDVCGVLGYTNVGKAVSNHCRPDGVTKRDTIESMGRTQSVIYLNEGNLYRLIAESKLPAAERFESWVFDEVLPSIRKTGKYAANDTCSTAEVRPELEAARLLPTFIRAFRAMGFDNNTSAISANRMAHKLTGANLLALAGYSYLDTPEQDVYFSVSRLVEGLSGQKANKLLEAAGFQVRINGQWEPTMAGKKFSFVAGSRMRHTNGEMIRHVRWLRDVAAYLPDTA